MKDKNLVASVALFSELYNNEQRSSYFGYSCRVHKGAVVSEKISGLLP
jgi:hypothetical protein